ncbi:MAG: aspartate aminotransferase family protein [Chloroflexi bacterium]|nr:aspartate aminotransferase family protein [Chloroflexota bacterium]
MTTQDALQREIDTYIAKNPKSQALNAEASKYLPGGDSRNSIYWPPYPAYIVGGDGVSITDADGNVRTDFINNMTTLIVGHRNPDVVKAMQDQVSEGWSYPGPSPSQIRWAEIIVERVPSVEQVRFVNSGTEATLNAIRAARAFTGRQKLGKMEGGYHGTHDSVAVSVAPNLDLAGDANDPNALDDYEGLPSYVTDGAVVMPINDIENCERIIRANASELACVIVEPVNGRNGFVPAEPGFLEGLRAVTAELGIVLIFDEVISFRVSRGGSQEHYGVTPDMTTFGKVIGGGLPVGAFGGRADIMSLYDPSNGAPRVQHAGTFNGNPMTAAAGVATLEAATPEVYEYVGRMGGVIRDKLRALIAEVEAPMGVTGVESLWCLQFTPERVTDYRSSMTNDKTMTRAMFLGLQNEGYLLSPSCQGTVSSVHTEEDIDGLIGAVRTVLGRLGYA